MRPYELMYLCPPTVDEERQFLLMYLREFADSDGMLPIDFDNLVRDSFGELVGAR